MYSRPRVKLPDPGGKCEAHWSSGYAPNSDGPKGGVCGRYAKFVVTIWQPRWNWRLFVCSHHANALADEWRSRGVEVRVWYLLKRSARLVEEVAR